MLDSLFRPTCSHEKITPYIGAGYCPDCGEYVENHWYMTRCSCCGVKQKTIVKNGKVVASAKFCRNCGSSSFTVEELKEIDIVNINYATFLKWTIKRKRQNIIQTWVENNCAPAKLLPSF